MPIAVSKKITLGDSVVTLYSLDRGKTWISRPRDLRLFRQRQRHDEKILKDLLSTRVANDLETC
jgi:hypothetical protein